MSLLKKENGLILALLFLLAIPSIVAVVETQIRLTSTGIVAKVGLRVFYDSEATMEISSISWGTLEPNVTKTKTIYVKSESTVTLTLSVTTSGWNPAGIEQNFVFACDCNGKTIQPNQVIPVVLSLTYTKPGTMTNFGFDIVITGKG